MADAKLAFAALVAKSMNPGVPNNFPIVTVVVSFALRQRYLGRLTIWECHVDVKTYVDLGMWRSCNRSVIRNVMLRHVLCGQKRLGTVSMVTERDCTSRL